MAKLETDVPVSPPPIRHETPATASSHKFRQYEDDKYPIPNCNLKYKLRFKEDFISSDSWTEDERSVSENLSSVSSNLPSDDNNKSPSQHNNHGKQHFKTADDFVGSRQRQKGVFQTFNTNGDKMEYIRQLRNFIPPLFKNFPVEESLAKACVSETDPLAFEKSSKIIEEYENWAKTPTAIARQKELSDLIPDSNRLVAGKFNLAVIEKLLNDAGYEGRQLLRKYIYGFPFVGIIDEPGVFKRSSRLRRSLTKRKLLKLHKKNDKRLKRIMKRQDPLDQMNWDGAMDEVNEGVLEKPIKLDDLIAAKIPHVSTRRFGILQRMGKKYRPLDNCKKSGVNKVAVVRTPVQLSRIDDLVNALVKIAEAWLAQGNLIENLALFLEKEDHQKAYKQLPVRDSHKKYLYVVAKNPSDNELYAFKPAALMFGSIVSVIDYNLCSLMTQNLCRSKFIMAIVSYFDDFIKPSVGRHNKGELFKRINALIGHVVHPSKGEYGQIIEFLGIVFDLSVNGFVTLSLSEERIANIIAVIETALEDDKLSSTDAGSLAGKLSFAQCVCFGRFGRAKLKPIYSRQHIKFTSITKLNDELRQALKWFKIALRQNFKRTISLADRVTSIEFHDPGKIFRVITDAEGKGGLGAFVFPSNDPNSEIFVMAERFKDQTEITLTEEDSVINFLEALAPLMILRQFKEEMRDKTVIFAIDNTSALGALQKGYSSRFPNSVLASEFWEICASFHINPWFERVSTDDNCADEPSRGVETIANELNATVIRIYVNQTDVDRLNETLRQHKISRENNVKKT